MTDTPVPRTYTLKEAAAFLKESPESLRRKATT